MNRHFLISWRSMASCKETLFSDRSKLKFNNQLNETKQKFISQHVYQIEKTAGVLIPFCEVDGKPSLVFTQRSHSLKRNRGHVR